MTNTAEETKGVNGKVLGSKEYFKDLNERTEIADLLNSMDSIDYYADITSKNKAVKNVIDEIYQDLEANISVIGFIDKGNRKDLKSFILGLKSYLDISKSGNYTGIRNCKWIFDVTEKNRGGFHSEATQTEIDQAVKKIYNGVKNIKLSLSERKSIVEKAAKSGIKSAGAGNAVKIGFLADLAGSRKDNFIKDVWSEYQNKYQYKGIYKGRNGKVIGSKEYIEYYEKAAFGKKLNSKLSAEFEYKVNITKCMNLLGTLLTGDLEKEMEEKTRKQLIEAAENAKKCGGKVSIPNPPKRNEEERIILYSQILTVEETKHFAKSMKEEKRRKSIIVENTVSTLASIVLGKFIGSTVVKGIAGEKIGKMAGDVGSIIVGTGTTVYNIAKDEPEESILSMAADENKRVQIIITDSKYQHTSYSIQIEFEIID